MIDTQALQATVSQNIASEFGQTRLALIEAQAVNTALQAEITQLTGERDLAQKKFDTIQAENLALHAQLGNIPAQETQGG